jgi:hypothetical protein
MEIHIINGIKQNHIYAVMQMDFVPMELFNTLGVNIVFSDDSKIKVLEPSTRKVLYEGEVGFEYGEKVLMVKLVDVLSKENSELLGIDTADKLVKYIGSKIDISKFDSRAVLTVFSL